MQHPVHVHAKVPGGAARNRDRGRGESGRPACRRSARLPARASRRKFGHGDDIHARVVRARVAQRQLGGVQEGARRDGGAASHGGGGGRTGDDSN